MSNNLNLLSVRNKKKRLRFVVIAWFSMTRDDRERERERDREREREREGERKRERGREREREREA